MPKIKTEKIKETRQTAKCGSYFSRIQQNISFGWNYPEILIEVTTAFGKYASMRTYYYIKDGKIITIGDVSSSAGKNSKYTPVRDKVRELKSTGIKVYSLQQAVTLKF